MPDANAAVAVADSLAGTINSVGTLIQNNKNRKFTREMYDRQKNDNIEFWNMQNSYNTPAAQMERFKAAGLNPNLMYGQGNNGNSSPISTPDVQPLNLRNPEWGNALGGGLAKLSAIADIKIKQAQYNNLVTQNDAIKQEILLKSIQARAGEFDLGFKSEFRGVSADALKERVRQMRTGTDISLNRDAREAVMNSTNVQEAAERMITMRAERQMIPYRKNQMSASTAESYARIQNLRRTGKLDDLEIALRENNVTFRDPLWQRMVASVLDGRNSVDKAIESLKDFDRAGQNSTQKVFDWFRFPFPH